MRSRGNTYIAKSVLGNSVNNTTYKQTLGDQCLTTTFKPSNNVFKTQGAVSNTARVDRIKYNNIVSNNNSFKHEYGVHYSYTEDTPYFIKSKLNKCPLCITNNKKNYHFSNNYMNNINNV